MKSDIITTGTYHVFWLSNPLDNKLQLHFFYILSWWWSYSLFLHLRWSLPLAYNSVWIELHRFSMLQVYSFYFHFCSYYHFSWEWEIIMIMLFALRQRKMAATIPADNLFPQHCFSPRGLLSDLQKLDRFLCRVPGKWTLFQVPHRIFSWL